MIKFITCHCPDRFIRAAWLSFMPNGDVSFGLNDKTYISPLFSSRQFVWSAFNRVTAEYAISSDPSTLQKVKNPHFTFHAPHYFHLKANNAKGDDALFAGIADVDLTLKQQGEMPWIRAITAPLRELKTAGLTWTRVPTNDLPILDASEDASLQIGIDFVQAGQLGAIATPTTWLIQHGAFSIRVSAHFIKPQIATLSWFHSS